MRKIQAAHRGLSKYRLSHDSLTIRFPGEGFQFPMPLNIILSFILFFDMFSISYLDHLILYLSPKEFCFNYKFPIGTIFLQIHKH